MAKNKRPKTEHQPNTEKIPKTPKKSSNTKFTWSFSILDKEGPFGWGKCDCPQKYLDILGKKGSLEEKELTELYYQGSHSIIVSSLSKEAQKRLEEIHQDDIDSVFSFRLTGTNRVICIQDDTVMKVLWWDPDHLVCPSKKKNT